jgi:hypothetical protein
MCINTRDEGSVNFNKHYTYNFISQAIRPDENEQISWEMTLGRLRRIRKYNIKIRLKDIDGTSSGRCPMASISCAECLSSTIIVFAYILHTE